MPSRSKIVEELLNALHARDWRHLRIVGGYPPDRDIVGKYLVTATAEDNEPNLDVQLLSKVVRNFKKAKAMVEADQLETDQRIITEYNEHCHSATDQDDEFNDDVFTLFDAMYECNI